LKRIWASAETSGPVSVRGGGAAGGAMALERAAARVYTPPVALRPPESTSQAVFAPSVACGAHPAKEKRHEAA